MLAACIFASAQLQACAPTYAPHLDMPTLAAPALEAPTPVAMDPLPPPPQLPDVDKSQTSCPPDSGFITCFTPANEAIRQRRFTLLHEDRDNCRAAYTKAMNHASGN